MGIPMTEAEIDAYQLAAHQLLDMEALAFEQDPDKLEAVFIDDILQPLAKILEQHNRDVVTLLWLITHIQNKR